MPIVHFQGIHFGDREVTGISRLIAQEQLTCRDDRLKAEDHELRFHAILIDDQLVPAAIDADEAPELDFQAGLLQHLPAAAFINRLARLHPAARQTP